MKPIIYCNIPQKDASNKKLKLKLPNYLTKRKIMIIREKIIARKYGILYLRKVFGKYYPSECRRYCEQRTLRNFFHKLKAHWFEEKQVHRLLYKANVFFNQKLISKIFNEWQSYIKKSKIVKQQESIVKHNHDELRLKNVLRNWKTITERRKKYKLMRGHAIESYCLVYTLMLLLKLAKYLSDEIEGDLLGMRSILCGRLFILQKYTRRWKIYIFQQKNYRILRSKADNYYKSKVRVIYFSHWQKYICYKRTKYEIVKLCIGLYEDRLLKMVVQFWKNKTRSQIIGKRNMLLAYKFYDDLSKRKLIKTWRRYVKHKLQGRMLKHKAAFFYLMRLKQKALNALSEHVTRCKNSKLAIQKLKLFYRRLLIMTVWNKWVKIIDEKNDFESRGKLSLAVSFYRESTIRKYSTKWVRYHTIQQRKKALEIKAVDLSKTFYCKRYLIIWKIVYRKRRRVTMLEEKALQFFNNSLMHQAILQWIKSYNCKISMKAKYDKSVLHYGKKLISKCFTFWVNFCNEKIRTTNLLNEAGEYYLEMLKRKILNKLSMNVVRMKIIQGKIQDVENFYKKNLMIKAFANWKEHCFQAKELKKKVGEFDERMRNNLKRIIFTKWKLYVHYKKCSHRKTLMSSSHRRKRACSKIFEQLKKYVNYKKDKNIRLTYLHHGVEGIHQNLRKIYFQRWRVARLNFLKEKCRIFHANEFHKSNLKHKYILLWQTFLIQHKIKRQHQSNLNNMMSNFILKQCLRLWYSKYQALLENHSNERWAGRIYEMKIKYKYFIAWKYFAEICTREKREINNAKEFHKKLVIKEGLQHLIKLFLCNTELRFEIQLKNVERNSTHEFELLRKYFNKWHKVVSTKNQNQLQVIEDQINLKDIIPRNLQIDDRKYVSNLIPRFIIPEFMKKEIKLRFGIGRFSNQIPINVKERKISRCGRITKMAHPLSNQKLSKSTYRSQIGDNSQEMIRLELKNKSQNDQKCTNDDIIRTQRLRHDMKTLSRNKKSHILSPDSLKSDSDSAKTYIVQNPAYSQNSNRISLSRNLLRLEVSNKKYNKENNYELLPPAAFYVSLKK